MTTLSFDPSLYLVTDRSCMLEGSEDVPKFLAHLEKCIAGGVTMIQLREKHLETKNFIDLAKRVLAVTRNANIPLIIDDRVDVCLAADADGVHLGPEDMPVSIARNLLGNRKIIGFTAHDTQSAKDAHKDGADYLGTEAIFEPPTRLSAGPLGLDGLKEIIDSVPIPVVAIGGIREDNIGKALQAKPAGIACVSALMATKEPQKVASAMKKCLGQNPQLSKEKNIQE